MMATARIKTYRARTTQTAKPRRNTSRQPTSWKQQRMMVTARVFLPMMATAAPRSRSCPTVPRTNKNTLAVSVPFQHCHCECAMPYHTRLSSTINRPASATGSDAKQCLTGASRRRNSTGTSPPLIRCAVVWLCMCSTTTTTPTPQTPDFSFCGLEPFSCRLISKDAVDSCGGGMVVVVVLGFIARRDRRPLRANKCAQSIG